MFIAARSVIYKPTEGKPFKRRKTGDERGCKMGIRNNAGWWERFKHFYPKIGLAAEILGVLMMMVICCAEF
ncbi:hypothetical protein HVZ26_22580 (plasmid) [Escherichia coli]|nr:hypothetical protein HVZ26_22580 [Escherichia coli]